MASGSDLASLRESPVFLLDSRQKREYGPAPREERVPCAPQARGKMGRTRVRHACAAAFACVVAALLHGRGPAGSSGSRPGAALGGAASGRPSTQLAAAAEAPGHVLIFTETAAFRHTEAIAQGTPKIVAALEAAGITSDVNENSADLHRREPRALRRDRDVPGVGRPVDGAGREGGARALPGGRPRHRGDPQRDRHARQLRVVGQPRRLADARPRGHRHEPRPARRDHRRGPRAPVHEAPHGQPLGARGRVVQLHRPTSAATPTCCSPMDETTYDPGGNAHGLRPPDRVVQALRRRPRLGHRARPLRRPLRRARVPPAHRRRRPVRGRPRARRLRRHDQLELREGHARRQHERAVRARRRARRPRLLHRARPRPDPRLRPGRPAASRPALTLDVYSGGEDGLLGITVDPDFATNGFIYVYYAPQSANNNDPANWFSRVSRFTVGDERHRSTRPRRS